MTAKKKRRWRRWLWRLAIAAIVARLLLALFLPQVLALGARWFGLTLTVRDASLSIAGLSLRLEDFAVGDPARPEAPPLLAAHELEFDASFRDLLRGELVIVDAALVSARVVLERGNDGQLRLPAAFSGAAAAPSAPPPTPAAPVAPAASAARPTFALPARVVSARLHDVVVRLIDAHGVAPREHEITIDADVRDLGRERPGGVVVRVHAPEWFDTAWLRAEVNARESLLQVDWRCEIQGVQPARHELPDELRSLFANAHTVGATVRGSFAGRIDAGGRREFSGNVRAAVEVDGDERVHSLLAIGPTTEDGANVTIPFAVDGSFRECVQSLQVRDAEVVLGGDEVTVHGRLAIERATLGRMRPVLAARGIELPETGLGVQATFDAAFGASLSASLRDVVVQGGGEAVRLAALQVRDVRTDAGGIAIGGISSNGPELQLVRTADGALRLAGVRVAPPVASAATPAPTPAATPPAGTGATTLPRVRLGALECTGLQLEFRDEATPGAAPLRVDEVALRGNALTLGADAPPGRLAAHLRLVGGLETLQLEATIAPTASSLAVNAQVTGTGLTAKSLAPWLQRLGITPALANGELACTAAVSVAANAGALALDVQLADVYLRDGDEPLFAIARVSGKGVRLGAGEIDVGDWCVEAPMIAVHRRADGHLRLLGMDLDPAAAAAPPAPPPPHSTEAPAATTRGTLRLGDVDVRGAVVRLGDERGAPVDFGIDATVRGAGDADAVPFEAKLHIADACERAELRGTFSREQLRVDAHCDVVGLRGEGLQRLLPAHVRCTLADGAASLRLRATLPTATQGASIELDALRLLDRGEELAALERVQLQLAPDAPDRSRPDRLHIAALDAHGLRAEVAITADGLRVPGFVLAPRAPDAAPAPQRAGGPVRIPLLAIDALTVACERVVVRDLRADGGEPLVVVAQLTMDPWRANDDAEKSPPAKLHLRATAEPLCRELQVDVEADPYALQPTIVLALRAAGLDLTALQRVSPTLGTTVQGTTNNAELAATVNARLDLKRRDAHQFDFSRPFGGDFLIDGVRYVDAANGQPLLGVDAVEVVARAIDPKTGDVLLRSVAISEPHIEIVRQADGVHVAGVCVATAQGGSPAPRTGRTPEFAVDNLQIDGLRVTVSDATTTPPTVLPIGDGEVVLRRFSTRTFSEARPFAFDVSLRGGDLAFPKRIIRSSVFAGMVGSAAAAVTGNTEQKFEQRALFDEFRVSGSLQPSPYPRGHVRVDLVAFELVALCGTAKRGGVDIADGVLDHHVDVEIKGPDGTHMSGNNVFTWLSISEPPGGPISTYLRMPAPLEYVLWLLRNDADEHHLPFDFDVPTAGIVGGAVRDKAAEALARMIGDAVAGAASRTLGAFTGMLRLTGGVHQPLTGAVPFAAGDPLPGASDLSTLLAAVAGDEQIEVVLTHELGAGDLERAAALATPPREQIAAQAEYLRARRMAVGSTRPALAADLDSLYAAGRLQEAHVRRAQLAAQDELFDELQRTLEQTIDMFVDDNPRAARRRTLAAAAALGQQRLGAVRAAVLRALPPAAANRVVVRPARGTTNPELAEGGRVIGTTRRRIVR